MRLTIGNILTANGMSIQNFTRYTRERQRKRDMDTFQVNSEQEGSKIVYRSRKDRLWPVFVIAYTYRGKIKREEKEDHQQLIHDVSLLCAL